MPLQFEQNVGQVDARVKFFARGHKSTLYLTANEFLLSMTAPGGEMSSVRIAFAGANDAPRVAGVGDVVSHSNYLTGNDRASWRTSVASYSRLRYQDIYPNVDLIVYGHERQIEYDLVIGPHTSPASIRLAVTGGKASVDDLGNLLINTSVGRVSLSRPRAYQNIGHLRREITAGYRVIGSREIGFSVEDYDDTKPLVIDPVLAYSTYLGGSEWDWPNAIKVDRIGNAYICGFTGSLNFPTTTGQMVPGGSSDAFIAKIRPDGSLEYSTFLGGVGADTAQALAVDASGTVTLTGETQSTDFPVIGAMQPTYAGGPGGDAFIAKLDASGSTLLYSSYFGGSGTDAGVAITTDGTGTMYVAGLTNSVDFPLVTPLQSRFGGGFADAFLAKLNAEGTALLYSTYLGGSASDEPSGMTVGPAGEIYIVGGTFSNDFPVVAALQSQLSGIEDGFVAKLRADGSALTYSTYLGGSGFDRVNGAKADVDGSVLLSGFSQGGFPTTSGAYQPFFGQGFSDAFVSRLSPDGQRFVFSTYFGGSDAEGGGSITTDAAGRIWVAGGTSSTNLPMVRSVQATYGDGGQDAFVAEFSATGSQLLFSTYLGGTDLDSALGLDVDGLGNVHVIGETESADFPTVQPFQGAKAGSREVFVASIVMNHAPTADAGPDQTVSADAECRATVRLDGAQSSDPDGDSLSYTWSGSFGSATGPSPLLVLGTGTHVITLAITDGNGGTSFDLVQVTVADTIPPDITRLSATPATLAPPNHQMIQIAVATELAPSCGTTTSCRIVAISSNEPENGTGDGDTSPDWVITGPLTAQLRAERAGSGTSRVYTILVRCTDGAGNSSTGTVTITVP
jgi:hypothetical protein